MNTDFSVSVYKGEPSNLFFLSRMNKIVGKQDFGDTFSFSFPWARRSRSKVALDSYKSHLVNMAAEKAEACIKARRNLEADARPSVTHNNATNTAEASLQLERAT